MIIAFVGKKGSGKSTACEYLSTDNTIRINFKDKLIEELRTKFPELLQAIIKTLDDNAMTYNPANPWTVERLFTEKPLLVRTLMQNYGTDVCRASDPDYFVKTWEAKVAEYHDHRILTDDCRFISEYEAVRRQGGVVIRIERVGLVSTDTHTSELEMDSIPADYTIKASTKDELYTQLDSIIKTMGV
jgi:hypothetical protein